MFDWANRPDLSAMDYQQPFATRTLAEDATLTFLDGGGFVLGVPRGTEESERMAAVEAIKHYLSGENGGIVLPWPVDVDDQRRNPE